MVCWGGGHEGRLSVGNYFGFCCCTFFTACGVRVVRCGVCAVVCCGVLCVHVCACVV